VKLSDIAAIVGGSRYGRDLEIRNILPPEDAQRNDLAFLFNPSKKTRAGAVIARHKIAGKSGVVVNNPQEAMYILLKKISTTKRRKRISHDAVIEEEISIPRSCVIEPFAVIKRGARIGTGTYIGAHAYIDEDVSIGKDCEIHANTTIYKNSRIGDFVSISSNTVVGKEGFGYLRRKSRYERLRHIGGVVIRDFVDIGSNVTIDRGTIGDTVLGEGTKIDNQVHIAHNVKIGKHCIIMGQVGIAGSTKIGNNVILCGQVGIGDHLKIGDNVIVYAKSGVFKSLPHNREYSGTPAREHRAVLRAIARLYKGR